ncbi:hypothetical protein [Acidovorax sp. 93]|jgi:hypothetical protein|uniref:hypothetical protein n=1 Tax=Acidovorax sp. 93 TaxID=2135632 RepID=UPI0011C4A28E|nr:hypothetical protein [Acidovorax sp. 93]
MNELNSFSRWVYLLQQVHEARYYIARAEELGHPHLWTSYEAILEFLAHFRGAINAYAKCFVSAGAGRKRLEISSVFGTDTPLIEKHRKIIDLRHKYVSHSDENEFESVVMSKNESAEELVIHLEYNLSFPFDRLYDVQELIRLVEQHVVDAQQSHIAAMARRLGKPVRVQEGANGGL